MWSVFCIISYCSIRDPQCQVVDVNGYTTWSLMAIQINGIVRKDPYPPLSLLLAATIIKQEKKGKNVSFVWYLSSVLFLATLIENNNVRLVSASVSLEGKEEICNSWVWKILCSHTVYFMLFFTFENLSCPPFNLLHPCFIIYTVQVLYCTVLYYVRTRTNTTFLYK